MMLSLRELAAQKRGPPIIGGSRVTMRRRSRGWLVRHIQQLAGGRLPLFGRVRQNFHAGLLKPAAGNLANIHDGGAGSQFGADLLRRVGGRRSDKLFEFHGLFRAGDHRGVLDFDAWRDLGVGQDSQIAKRTLKEPAEAKPNLRSTQ